MAADIPVGEVVSVTHSSDYLTREVMVKLYADSMNVKVVELVGIHHETVETDRNVYPLAPYFVNR